MPQDFRPGSISQAAHPTSNCAVSMARREVFGPRRRNVTAAVPLRTQFSSGFGNFRLESLGASFTLGCLKVELRGALVAIRPRCTQSSLRPVAEAFLLGQDCCMSLHAGAWASPISCGPDQDVCQAHKTMIRPRPANLRRHPIPSLVASSPRTDQMRRRQG